MEKYKKYFEFSGTINGSNYFLRNIIATIVSFFGGYMTGYGIGMSDYGLITLGLVVLVPSFLFSFATIYKRVNALFPENSSVITAVFIVSQIVGQFFKGEPLGGLFTLGLLIFGLVLIFKNSGIENHEG